MPQLPALLRKRNISVMFEHAGDRVFVISTEENMDWLRILWKPPCFLDRQLPLNAVKLLWKMSQAGKCRYTHYNSRGGGNSVLTGARRKMCYVALAVNFP